jgi:Tat protein secretion system quality control protein TatD with DNase activity
MPHQRNSPEQLSSIANELAKLRNCTADIIYESTTRNALAALPALNGMRVTD